MKGQQATNALVAFDDAADSNSSYADCPCWWRLMNSSGGRSGCHDTPGYSRIKDYHRGSSSCSDCDKYEPSSSNRYLVLSELVLMWPFLIFEFFAEEGDTIALFETVILIVRKLVAKHMTTTTPSSQLTGSHIISPK
eukprot:scaffold10845_cov103-Skeletonema_dohrnii-CCMP3373.AAC.2